MNRVYPKCSRSATFAKAMPKGTENIFSKIFISFKFYFILFYFISSWIAIVQNETVFYLMTHVVDSAVILSLSLIECHTERIIFGICNYYYNYNYDCYNVRNNNYV